MKRENIDMWIVLAREYNEDPVFRTLTPALIRTASRLSCLIFSLNNNNELEALSISRPNPIFEKIYKSVWNPDKETQWECLRRIVSELNPKKIGINISDSFALADGLTKSLYDKLLKSLNDEYSSQIVSAEKLCIGWLEKRSLSEIQAYNNIYRIACSIIEEAFSNEVIKIDETTTEDVQRWIMEKINDLGLKAWFTPTIDLQRKGTKNSRISNTVIRSGDILHCDVGIEYLGLCTDTQRLAYVLKPEEKHLPTGLKDAIGNCNEFQDIVTENFLAGRTGNEILVSSLKEAKTQSIKAVLYTHPIGFNGHGAGPTIGLWDNQNEIPIKGEYPLYNDTCYALELNTAINVPEWDNQEVFIFLEETVCFRSEGVKYINGRQTEFIIIES